MAPTRFLRKSSLAWGREEKSKSGAILHAPSNVHGRTDFCASPGFKFLGLVTGWISKCFLRFWPAIPIYQLYPCCSILIYVYSHKSTSQSFIIVSVYDLWFLLNLAPQHKEKSAKTVWNYSHLAFFCVFFHVWSIIGIGVVAILLNRHWYFSVFADNSASIVYINILIIIVLMMMIIRRRMDVCHAKLMKRWATMWNGAKRRYCSSIAFLRCLKVSIYLRDQRYITMRTTLDNNNNCLFWSMPCHYSSFSFCLHASRYDLTFRHCAAISLSVRQTPSVSAYIHTRWSPFLSEPQHNGCIMTTMELYSAHRPYHTIMMILVEFRTTSDETLTETMKNGRFSRFETNNNNQKKAEEVEENDRKHQMSDAYIYMLVRT